MTFLVIIATILPKKQDPKHPYVSIMDLRHLMRLKRGGKNQTSRSKQQQKLLVSPTNGMYMPPKVVEDVPCFSCSAQYLCIGAIDILKTETAPLLRQAKEVETEGVEQTPNKAIGKTQIHNTYPIILVFIKRKRKRKRGHNTIDFHL
jgi:hypothetical protein